MTSSINPLIVALVVEGLRRMAPEVEVADVVPADLLGRSQVPTAMKMELLQRAYDHGGAELVLRLGRVYLEPDLPPHPLVLLFRNASTVDGLLHKVDTLYRFMHSNHRLKRVSASSNGLVIEHLEAGDTPTSNLESLWVCGLLAAGLAHLGCRGLRVTLPLTGESEPVFESGEFRSPRTSTGVHRFAFAWQTQEPRTPLPGLDQYVLDTANLSPIDPVHTMRARVTRLVATDLTRRWTVGRVAEALAVAPRTLQRALASEQTTFRDLLAEVRVKAAQELMRTSAMSITDIGFVTGFADNAHFSRRFRAATGCTPSVWRERLPR